MRLLLLAPLLLFTACSFSVSRCPKSEIHYYDPEKTEPCPLNIVIGDDGEVIFEDCKGVRQLK